MASASIVMGMDILSAQRVMELEMNHARCVKGRGRVFARPVTGMDRVIIAANAKIPARWNVPNAKELAAFGRRAQIVVDPAVSGNPA